MNRSDYYAIQRWFDMLQGKVEPSPKYDSQYEYRFKEKTRYVVEYYYPQGRNISTYHDRIIMHGGFLVCKWLYDDETLYVNRISDSDVSKECVNQATNRNIPFRFAEMKRPTTIVVDHTYKKYEPSLLDHLETLYDRLAVDQEDPRLVELRLASVCA